MQIKISIILFEEKLTNVQLIFPKQNQHDKIQNKITSSMKCFTQLQHKFSTLTTPHTNPTQLEKLIVINLQFFKKVMFFNQVVILFY
jgi:hypothetical protein